MNTHEHTLRHRPGPLTTALTRIFTQRLALAESAMEEALCRMFERAARVLMAYGGETRSAKKEAS